MERLSIHDGGNHSEYFSNGFLEVIFLEIFKSWFGLVFLSPGTIGLVFE